jgi:hypothetical protein
MKDQIIRILTSLLDTVIVYKTACIMLYKYMVVYLLYRVSPKLSHSHARSHSILVRFRVAGILVGILRVD